MIGRTPPGKGPGLAALPRLGDQPPRLIMRSNHNRPRSSVALPCQQRRARSVVIVIVPVAAPMTNAIIAWTEQPAIALSRSAERALTRAVALSVTVTVTMAMTVTVAVAVTVATSVAVVMMVRCAMSMRERMQSGVMRQATTVEQPCE